MLIRQTDLWPIYLIEESLDGEDSMDIPQELEDRFYKNMAESRAIQSELRAIYVRYQP